VLEVARCECFTSQAGRSDMEPAGRWKQHCIRLYRNQCWLYQNSAGRIVPFVSLGKPRERKGALLQLTRLEGVKDV